MARISANSWASTAAVGASRRFRALRRPSVWVLWGEVPVLTSLSQTSCDVYKQTRIGERATHQIAENCHTAAVDVQLSAKSAPTSFLSAMKLSQTQPRRTRWHHDVGTRPTRRSLDASGFQLEYGSAAAAGISQQLRSPGSSFHPHQLLLKSRREGLDPAATEDGSKYMRPA